MHCTCGARDGYGAVYLDGLQTDLWVCARCSLPNRSFFERKLAMHVPKDCISPLGSRGRRDGIWETDFACKDGVRKKTITFHPYPFGVTKVAHESSRHYLLELWRKLDAEVAGLKVVNNPSHEDHKSRATAFSEVIHMLMGDYYSTREDVVREALARYEHRNDSPNDHETPGLAEKLWDPASRVPVSTLRKTAPVVSSRALSGEEIEAVKNALASGAFTIADMATMFKTSPEVISQYA